MHEVFLSCQALGVCVLWFVTLLSFSVPDGILDRNHQLIENCEQLRTTTPRLALETNMCQIEGQSANNLANRGAEAVRNSSSYKVL